MAGERGRERGQEREESGVGCRGEGGEKGAVGRRGSGAIEG